MKLTKREIRNKEDTELRLKFIGYNSNGVLTLCCADGDERLFEDKKTTHKDIILNIKDNELQKLKDFLARID